ncbi:AbrB family transcriptional regulator [Pelagovum pacificum]|uniref:AbrB family transcriptional regulator n=2 Tax=Pelagovum pacificum TaxID=2588711 RepID=A0A5C5GM10_9RHOB|nr:AbrB family transcriptional regulator [Pelagovum pacificum]QQA44147.1 AbrB family transcriptional regulator [Pelagovum pacificum]TNY34326.1 AbrB family transcriptional regulator [Pelagovum pacificum]
MGLALAIGASGGAIFFLLGLPLAWMLGAMIFTLIAVLLRAPLLPPERIREPTVTVIGVLLGSNFSPELLGDISGWLLSIFVLVIYMIVAAALVVPFYLKIGRMDPPTAFFAAMPGGISEMMLIGESMGGDGRRIILAHAARIVITIGSIAFFFRVVLGLDVSGVSMSDGHAPLALSDIALLIGSGLIGYVFGTRLNLPAPGLIGPMIVSGTVHMLGWTGGVPPGWVVMAAQVILGTIMGCRFLGTPPQIIARALLLSLGATTVMLAVSLGFAVVFAGVFGQTVAQVLLAYAPGGLTEMSLVALSMDAEVAYITVHHVVRIVLLIAVAPSLLSAIAKRL